MTVSTEVSRVDYIGAGTAGPFTIPYPFFSVSDLIVVKTVIATGVGTFLQPSVGFIATGAQNPTGGSLVTVAPVNVGERIMILRGPQFLQEIDYVENNKFPAESHEEALDRQVMMALRLAEKLKRTIIAPEGDVGNFLLPALQARANKYLGFDADGNITMLAAASLPTPGSVQGLNVKDFGATGDGVTDDRAFIQNCIDAVFAMGGGIVYIPRGTYLIGDSLNYKTNVQIMGAGRGATIIKLKPGSALTGGLGIIQPAGYGTPLPASGHYSQNNYFAHFTIDGNIAGNGVHVYEGLEISYTEHVTAYDIESMNCGETGFHGQITNSGTDPSATIAFIGCVAHNNRSDGFQFGGVMVSNCFAYANGAAGFDSVGNYVGAVDNVYSQVVNCRAESNSIGGFAANLQVGAHVRTLFSNCVAYRNTGIGFTVAMNYTSLSNCEAQFNTSSGAAIQASFCTVTGGKYMNNGQVAAGFRAGIECNGGPTFVDIAGAILTDDQGVKTQQYALAIAAPGFGSNNKASNCIMIGNAAGTLNVNNATDWRITDCSGYNPLGSFTGVIPRPANPAVGASPFSLTNNYGFPIRIFISAGNVTDITITAVSTGLVAGMFVVGPGETITVTYTVVPIFRVSGL